MAMQRSRRLATLAATLLLVIAPACGSDEAGDAAMEASTGGDTVSIEDFVYKPAELTVKAGTTVSFTNEDGFAHTVTADDRSYDSGNLDEGESFDHVYDQPGTYEYFCAIHNSMTGSVVVE
jgi:plastocyanin